MISKKMLEGLNKQVNAELSSAYTYLAIANYCVSRELSGCAHWFSVQAQEELGHAKKIYDYIHLQLEVATLLPIAQPQSTFGSIVDIFEFALQAEKNVTGMISELVNLAVQEKDHATQGFLQWFVTEQLEEEASAVVVLEKAKRLKDSNEGVYLLDTELSKRGGQ